MEEATVQPAHVHVPPEGFIRKHVFSLDHKVIGKQYYGLALVAVFMGMALSWLMRFHLVWPNTKVPGLNLLSSTGAPGGVITPEYYLSLMTMHGTLMVFFVLTNAPFAGFGNFFLPIQIGAEDMAFPRFNMMSFWTTAAAFVVLVLAFFIPDGPPISGWTAYAPLSAVGSDAGPGLGWGQNLWAISIGLFCIGQLLGSLNFIATTLDLRTKGMTLMRMPICTWAWFITSCIGLLAFAVLLPACLLLILDRMAGTSFFIPSGLVVSDRLQNHAHGSPLLWQHLFWFFGHPEVYIMILPGFGMISEIIPVFSRKPIFGYKAIAAATAVIAFLATLVWAHHMFAAPVPIVVLGFFMLSSFLIGVPTGVKIFNWIATLWRGSIVMTTALYFAVGFIANFVIGGITGIFLAVFPIDWQLNNTYFVVAHFHYVLMGGAVFTIFAGLYYWFPKITGRMLNETWGKASFW